MFKGPSHVEKEWKGDSARQVDQLGVLEHGGDRLGTHFVERAALEPAGERRGVACQKCSWGLGTWGREAGALDALQSGAD